jgi:hypothetical protein
MKMIKWSSRSGASYEMSYPMDYHCNRDVPKVRKVAGEPDAMHGAMYVWIVA